jgi:hypothetical protein
MTSLPIAAGYVWGKVGEEKKQQEIIEALNPQNPTFGGLL